VSSLGTDDTIRDSFSGSESVRSNFEHLVEGTREVELNLLGMK